MVRMVFDPPPRLVRALGETTPDAADWLARLPEATRREVAARELSVERVQEPGGRSSLVVLVRLPDGTPAVLKLAPPRARPEAERAALEHWGGLGAVRLLAEPEATQGTVPEATQGTEPETTQGTTPETTHGTAPEAESAGPQATESVAPEATRGVEPPTAGGALLLERLHPDVSVRSLPEAKALLEASGVLRRLWVAPPDRHPFETVAERTGRQARAMRASVTGPDDPVAPLVDAALSLRDELLASPPEELLLHGTFRQSKILSGDRMPWLAVGPDPLIGESAFDLARLVRDRVEDLIAMSSGSSTTRRRVRRLADSLEVDQERLRGWTLFRAVESGVRARRVGRTRDAELLLEFATWL